MSAHFDISKISVFGLDKWSVAVCAWRGCCLEVFARAEHSVADCLRTLENAGVATGKDARHTFGSARLKALSACIASHDFGGHGTAALARIVKWEEVHELRAFLAHGTIKPTAKGVVIQHVTFDGKAEKRLPTRQLSRFEMLAVLAEIEQAQVQLHQMLGQIKALAARAKPIRAAAKPGSGSGPV
jgi:hypothetical protein